MFGEESFKVGDWVYFVSGKVVGRIQERCVDNDKCWMVYFPNFGISKMHRDSIQYVGDSEAEAFAFML